MWLSYEHALLPVGTQGAQRHTPASGCPVGTETHTCQWAHTHLPVGTQGHTHLRVGAETCTPVCGQPVDTQRHTHLPVGTQTHLTVGTETCTHASGYPVGTEIHTLYFLAPCQSLNQ